jgi:hypothetical protein
MSNVAADKEMLECIKKISEGREPVEIKEDEVNVIEAGLDLIKYDTCFRYLFSAVVVSYFSAATKGGIPEFLEMIRSTFAAFFDQNKEG